MVLRQKLFRTTLHSMNWHCLDDIDSSLPILSTAPQRTEVYAKYFPKRTIYKLYKCDEDAIEYAVKLTSTMPWRDALSAARNVDLYFDGYFPDIDGVVFITPDTLHFSTNAHYWQAKNPGRREVRTYPAKSTQQNTTIRYFKSIKEECEFLRTQDAVLFTKNAVLQKRLSWQNGIFMKFPEWRYTNATVAKTIMQDMSFTEKLEFVAPNKHDTIYKYMEYLSKFCTTGDFFRVLQDLLRLLEDDSPSLHDLLFADKSIVLCGLEEGEWPEPDSLDGAVMKALLDRSNVCATSALEGYGRSRLNCWASFCTPQKL